jgi:hypothetical protein
VIALLALAAGAAVAQYDCTLEAPKALSRQGANASLAGMGFPDAPEDWKFQIKVSVGKTVGAQIIWPKDPMQIAGTFAALPTAKGSIVFAAFSSGPCLFTETMCMSIVQLVDQPNGQAKIVVLPSALVTDKQSDTREPFIVIAQGTCTKAGENK